MEIQKGRKNQCYKTFAVATLIGHSKTSSKSSKIITVVKQPNLGHSKTSTKSSKIINCGKVNESWSF